MLEDVETEDDVEARVRERQPPRRDGAMVGVIARADVGRYRRRRGGKEIAGRREVPARAAEDAADVEDRRRAAGQAREDGGALRVALVHVERQPADELRRRGLVGDDVEPADEQRTARPDAERVAAGGERQRGTADRRPRRRHTGARQRDVVEGDRHFGAVGVAADLDPHGHTRRRAAGDQDVCARLTGADPPDTRRMRRPRRPEAAAHAHGDARSRRAVHGRQVGLDCEAVPAQQRRRRQRGRVVATRQQLEVEWCLIEAEVDVEAEREQAIDPVRRRPLREMRLLAATEEERIGRGADQDAARPQHAPHLGKRRLRIDEVLEHVECAHDVDARVGERQLLENAARDFAGGGGHVGHDAAERVQTHIDAGRAKAAGGGLRD